MLGGRLLAAGIAASLVALMTGRLADLPVPPPLTVATSAAPSEPAPSTRVQVVQFKHGDNLGQALVREGVDARVGADVAAALSASGVNLRRLQPHHRLEIAWDSQGEFQTVKYTPSPWLTHVAVARDKGWHVERSETRPDVRVEPVSGRVARSLFQAVEDTGESAQIVVQLVEIFSSDFDFTADTRTGDRFRLLVEKRYAGERFVDYARILVAQYQSDGRLLTGVGYERPGERFGYYEMNGRSLRKSFLKSPLPFTRITSGFTYARPHPVLGGMRPHLAIDYAAPVGTPVQAVADGTVARAGWDGGYGLSVRLRHRAGYETMYNHLASLARDVGTGSRVRQRQVIGYVGSTGLSSGPHLDYRVSRHGEFVNPLGEKFIPGEPIPPSERPAFLRHARELRARLESLAPFE